MQQDKMHRDRTYRRRRLEESRNGDANDHSAVHITTYIMCIETVEKRCVTGGQQRGRAGSNRHEGNVIIISGDAENARPEND